MHATTPRLYFQTLFQHEAVFVIMPERRLALPRHVSHGNTIIVFVSARSARYYAIQPSPSRSEVRARKKRGCSTRLGPRSDVTAKGASERLADFSIFNMAENLYIHSNNFVNTTIL
jgi:hypothetical protein